MKKGHACITCQKLIENLCTTLNKAKNGEPENASKLENKLNELITKDVEGVLFSSSGNNETCFVNFGRLFTKIDPVLLKGLTT